MTFTQKSELLSWFVDSMRSSLIDYFNYTRLFESMPYKNRIALLALID